MGSAIQKLAMNHRLSISSQASVAEALYAMKSAGQEAVIVYEIGRVFGVFTEHDILQKVIAQGLDPHTTFIRTVLEPVPVTAPDSIPVEDALNALHQEKRSHMVLVDPCENVVGIVSLSELLEVEVEQLHSENKDLASYLMADAPGG